LRASSRAEYEARIARAVTHIEANLNGALQLEDVARVACFSPFHFHRVFKGITGETLLDFVQRIRLERAARALYVNKSASVIKVSLDYGYENPSSFAKAFKRHFGASASQWRKSGAKAWIEERQKAKTARQPQVSKNGKEANPEVWQKLSSGSAATLPEPGAATVGDLDDFFVVLKRYVGPYGSPLITGVWHELMQWADARGLIGKDTTSLGVVHDDPFSTQPGRCRYDACVVVPRSFTTTDPDYRVENAPGGRYLRYHFVGRSTDVDPAWDRVYREWLPESGCQPDDRSSLEIYRPGSVLDPMELTFRCELCVPVRLF
jgi:AraC family transcriptional regulator